MVTLLEGENEWRALDGCRMAELGHRSSHGMGVCQIPRRIISLSRTSFPLEVLDAGNDVETASRQVGKQSDQLAALAGEGTRCTADHLQSSHRFRTAPDFHRSRIHRYGACYAVESAPRLTLLDRPHCRSVVEQRQILFRSFWSLTLRQRRLAQRRLALLQNAVRVWIRRRSTRGAGAGSREVESAKGRARI